MASRKLTLTRVVVFCLLCAITLAGFSGLTRDFLTEWKQHILLIFSIAITYGLTILFARWEKLPLKEVGVVASNRTFKKVVVGFGIGLLMTLLQLGFVLLRGHFYVTLTPYSSSYTIVFYLLLYILVAIREELAFRGYPLFSLNSRFGLWTSQYFYKAKDTSLSQPTGMQMVSTSTDADVEAFTGNHDDISME
jgi:uncharacterized protein